MATGPPSAGCADGPPDDPRGEALAPAADASPAGANTSGGRDPPDGSACDLLEGLTREPDLGYGPQWPSEVLRHGDWIDIDVYLAHSDVWSCAPTLRRYREVGKRGVGRVGEAFGRRVRALLERRAAPAVVCVEKPYLDGFIEGFGQARCAPFVLLAVNGGDEPFTREQQGRVALLRDLRACFVNNMHLPLDGGLFHPLPIGLNGEAFLGRILQSALPWAQRDRRLLVPPMRITNRLRAQYLEVLTRPEYGSLVRIVSERLGLEEFLALLSRHQSVLSPPGRGYDCARTWQAVAVGSVPLVVDDPNFDQRLHARAGPAYVPLPQDLSPDALEKLLSQLGDPAECAERVHAEYWKNLWASHLQ